MKNKFFINGILFSLFLIIAACATADFIANDFNAKTSSHKIVAIMPVEIVYKGKRPQEITEEQIKQIEEGESIAFQLSLYNNLLNKSGPKKKDIKISFQSRDKTNRLLNENNISITNSWLATPESLANLLGVDAVVKSKVEKTRYMSDLASYGVAVGISILDNAFGGIGVGIPGVSPIPYGAEKTNDIDAECTLYNGVDGSVLYKDVYNRSSDYKVRANQMIEHLTIKFSNTFPYRDK